MAGIKTSLLLEACKLTGGDMMLRFSLQTNKWKPRWMEQNQDAKGAR
jgi:hypothetical protein